MDPILIAAIAELLKISITSYVSFLRQQGISEAEIERLFEEARAGMLSRDPNTLPTG